MNQYKCWCHECLKDIKDTNGWPVTLSQMILCPDCGNKRCPKATNHNNTCTNSNVPNQPGSRYSDDYPFTPKITHHAAAYQIHDSIDYGALKIKPYETPFVIQCKNREGEEIFRLTQEGDIFWRGRKIESDEEIRKATTDFILTWMNGMNDGPK